MVDVRWKGNENDKKESCQGRLKKIQTKLKPESTNDSVLELRNLEKLFRTL